MLYAILCYDQEEVVHAWTKEQDAEAMRKLGLVEQKLIECNVRNYSIFVVGDILFAYYEYAGDDHDADMQRVADDPVSQEWWTHTDPLQEPLPDRQPGEWWAAMREVFHTD